MNASDALAIVAKDETKVARPKSWERGNLFFGMDSCLLRKLRLAIRKRTGNLFVPVDSKLDLDYLFVEWEVLTKSEVLSRAEVEGSER
jgi:hypothetical protein